MNHCYIDNQNKSDCVGCEACVQACSHSAIRIAEDVEGFRYPMVDSQICVNCGLCRKVCPINNMPKRYADNKIAYGGYIKDRAIKDQSTSGGAFSALVDAWCDENYVIFGAETDGLCVKHSYITDKSKLGKFRRSKYSQSIIGAAYKDVRRFLRDGQKVVFSGTPCQIAGLRSFLMNINCDNLLTIEVICEGVPTPHYIRRFSEWIEAKYGSPIDTIDYRFKDCNKWDFEVMQISITSKSHRKRIFKCDRWFNPFWSIWLNHLMSRPSCYECRFANTSRIADISLGDLWGVHIYCPDLYGKNEGASLVVCNTKKGKEVLEKAKHLMYGRELSFETALRYQSPMRKSIEYNIKRQEFMEDVLYMDYKTLTKKWAIKPTLKLLFQKYVWGNRQKVACWNFKQKILKII